MTKQKGFNLLEILIAWFILITVLLGTLKTQLNILKDTNQTYLSNIATNQISNMLERLRANHSFAARLIELQIWNQQNQQLLPEGQGTFDCDPTTNACTVEIFWQGYGRKKRTLIEVI